MKCSTVCTFCQHGQFELYWLLQHAASVRGSLEQGDNLIKNFTSRRMNKIINAKCFDSYTAIIISGTIQRQRCDACLNTVGYGKKVG